MLRPGQQRPATSLALGLTRALALGATAGLGARLRLSSQAQRPELLAGASAAAPLAAGEPAPRPCDHSSAFRIKMAARGLLQWRCVLPWQRLMPALTLSEVL